jgi:phosphoribosylformylglycinamidine synthase
VEATVIGRFTGGGRGLVMLRDRKIFDLDMNFLHDGNPRKELFTTYTKKDHSYDDFPDPTDPSNMFINMLSRLNTGSFEFISSQYDHEVQGNSLVKPLQGRGRVNGNTSVIRPVFESERAVALSQGLYPSYSDIDTYWMAACSIDTAIRNVVAVGGTLDHLALLDNFCWCDSNNPERLGQLKEAARACYDIAVAYGTPFISGKDSMFNDFRGYDEYMNEAVISIPPTLLISSIGVVSDWRRCQTIDFKRKGDLIYLLGETRDEMGGSEYLAFMGERLSGQAYTGNSVPRVYPEKFMRTYRALEAAMSRGLVASSISLERGGLGVALGKSALAGNLSFQVDLAAAVYDKDTIDRNDILLFSESQGRILVSVDPERQREFEDCMDGVPCALAGEVTDNGRMVVMGHEGGSIMRVYLDELSSAYRGVFEGF